MNNSTRDVTLYSGFIFDLLSSYEGSRASFAAPLFEMAEHLDPDNLTQLVPIKLYNEMCRWIETTLGAASLRKAGVEIGNRAYDYLTQGDLLAPDPSPLQIMQGLQHAANTMIQDPAGREWEIREVQEDRIVMRRTQTFNCILQEGLLKSLVARTGVDLPNAQHIACTKRGAEFCDYAVTWLQG